MIPDELHDLLRSLYFRKMFFLVAAILIAILFIIRYRAPSGTDPRGNRSNGTLVRVVDNIILFVFIAIVAGAFLFWLVGNG
jgi:hypothetical protein